MDWLVTIGTFWLQTLAWLAGLALAFAVLVRLTPCNPGMYWWKDLRAAATDFVYWFVVPLFIRVGRTVMLAAGVLLLFGGRDPQPLPVRHLPLWQQCLLVLLIQDVILYWLHRVFHTRLAWQFHAVHHSPKVLDWMSFLRFHPVNNLLEFALADVAVLLLGFRWEALAALMPFNLVYSAMVHANLNWTFGPLRYFLASPVFHRWHHTAQEEGLDRNFASTFPFLDLLFGTFYMPRGELPERFGNGEPDYPQGFWGQFLHPFLHNGAVRWARRRPTAATLAAVGLLVGAGVLGSWVNYTLRLMEQNARLAQEARRRQSGPGEGRRAGVTSVALSADGRHLVWGCEDGTVKISDGAEGGEERVLSGHERRVTGVAVSADGGRIVSGSYDGTVRVWDGRTGRQRLVLTGHAGAVLSVAVSADGSRIVSGGGDRTARVWDAETGREELTLGDQPAAVPAVAISGDGRRVVTASAALAKVWDTGAGREVTLKGHADLVYCVAISPDGGRVVTGSYDETARVWGAETGREELSLKGHAGPVYAVAVSAAGAHVVSGGKDGTVRAWDGQGRQERMLTGHEGAVTAVAVSAEGERIVFGGRDGAVRVWDAGTGPGGAPAAPRLLRQQAAQGTPGRSAALPPHRRAEDVGLGRLHQAGRPRVAAAVGDAEMEETVERVGAGQAVAGGAVRRDGEAAGPFRKRQAAEGLGLVEGVGDEAGLEVALGGGVAQSPRPPGEQRPAAQAELVVGLPGPAAGDKGTRLPST